MCVFYHINNCVIFFSYFLRKATERNVFLAFPFVYGREGEAQTLSFFFAEGVI